jgi:tuftelin-interacting protein 11
MARTGHGNKVHHFLGGKTTKNLLVIHIHNTISSLLCFEIAMARRKNGFLSDGSDSDASASGGSEGVYNSQEDADSKAERALFEYKGNKRRKMAGTGGKDAAWEGIFGEGEEEYGGGGRGLGVRRGRGGGSTGRTDWTK